MKNVIPSRKVSIILLIGIVILSWIVTLNPISAQSNSLVLDTNIYPSNQGWVFNPGTSSASEFSVFSIGSGFLHMDSTGVNFSGVNYQYFGIVNPDSPFTLTIQVQVTNYDAGDNVNPYGFEVVVDTGVESFDLAISPFGIRGGPQATFFTTSINVAQLHEYRIEATPGVGYELFIDGVSYGTVSSGGSSGNYLLLGDGTAGASAVANIASYVFTQMPSKPTLALNADDTSVWANGRQETKLTVTLTDANGQPIEDRQILVEANPPEGVNIQPTNGSNTNANGEVIFTATSDKANLVTITATDSTDSSVTDSVEIDFQRHKVVVQFLGIRTSLQCDPSTGDCIYPCDTVDCAFNIIRAILLASKGFEKSDLIWYSYQGGTIDQSTGKWTTRNYACENTAQDYRLDIGLLRVLLQQYGTNNPNTDFYLLGHSQGGLIAFQGLGLINSLPPKTRIGGIITLDSPLGGSPVGHTILLERLTCWRGPAAQQLNRLYRTVPDSLRDQQGSVAQPLCSLPGIGTCNFPTNEAAVAVSGVPTFTFGSLDDGVFNPVGKCPIPTAFKLLASANNTASQIVRNAGGGLFPLGENIGWLTCIPNSHNQAFVSLAGPVTTIIGSQFGSP